MIFTLNPLTVTNKCIYSFFAILFKFITARHKHIFRPERHIIFYVPNIMFQAASLFRAFKLFEVVIKKLVSKILFKICHSFFLKA